MSLLDVLQHKTDHHLRWEANAQLTDLFVDQVPAIGLFRKHTAFALSERVVADDDWPGARLVFWDIGVGDPERSAHPVGIER